MTSTLPTGVVSFLFTDVEGSTRLWDADAGGMAASLALHDRILREAVVAHRGHVFSTAGDAFAVAFRTPADAIAAALDVQRRLHTAEWPGPPLGVRTGIHTGTTEERDGNYFGPVLNRAARIMAAGNGGQILVSSVTAGMCRSGLDPEASLTDLGVHLLADLEEPEHLFELTHDMLPPVTAPIRTVDSPRHNLPEYLTSFVGRGSQLEELSGSIRRNRLVVLTGVGGTGKTRLAVEAGRRLAGDFADGVWLVELAPVTTPALIMQTIGDVWGLRPGEGATIDEVVARHLRSKDLLLTLDNCEHLLDGAAAAVRHLLAAARGLRIVATSRESLGIPGEALVRVPSLPLPGDGDVRESEAVRLFVDRAAAARPDLSPSDADLPAIRRICVRVDGIPLGLELAAARIRSMSFRELADRIEESFRILSGSAKTALPRQRTLEATVEWSHDLLKPDERAVFRRLSMFAGGFDLAAAEAVCRGDDIEEANVIDHLDSLVDKSLLLPSQHPEAGTRYRMLEPVRQYAQERLAEAEETDTVLQAHAGHYAWFAATAGRHTRGPDQMEWERRLDVDYDNIRTAFRTLLETGDIEPYLDMAFDLSTYWEHVGMHLEGIATAVKGLEAAKGETRPERLLKGWWTASALGAEITRPQSIDHAERGLAVAKAIGDPNAIGRMTLALGRAIRHSSDSPDYLGHLVEARRLLEESPEPHWWEPEWEDGLINLILGGYLPVDEGRTREHLERAIGIFEGVGDRASLGAALVESTSIWGDDEEWVLSNLRRAVEILGEMKVPYWQGHALMLLGTLLNERGDLEDARSYLSEAAGYLEDSGDMFCWANSNRGLAAAESRLGRPEAARQRIAGGLESIDLLPMQEIAKLRTLDTAADVLAGTGETRAAAVVLGCAAGNPFPVVSVIARPHERLRRGIAETLGDEETARLMDEGARLTVDEGLQRAIESLT